MHAKYGNGKKFSVNQHLENYFPWLVLGTAISFLLFTTDRFIYFFDDAFIAFRIAENLVHSGKPYFNTEEPLFTSTSLLFPIWNAGWYMILGKVWIDKMHFVNGLCQSLLLAGLFFKLRNGCHFFTQTFLLLGLVSVLLSPMHSAAVYAGMECILFQTVLFFTLLRANQSHWSWAALLIRPEGFLAGLAAFLAEGFGHSWQKAWKRHLFPAATVALVYAGLSWFWYGSFFPQSIWAKSHYDTDRLQQIFLGLQYLFMPGYGLFAFVIGATWFQFPACRKDFLPILLWLLFHTFFFSLVASWWAWYVPPMFIGMAYLVGQSIKFWAPTTFPSNKKTPSYLPYIFLFLSLWHGWSSFHLMKKNAEAFVIRWESSKKISAYLENHLSENQNVLLEPLGLLAYYSRKTSFLDYPGLTQAKMSTFLSTLPWKIPIQMTDAQTNLAVLTQFKPDYLLIFPYEKTVFMNLHGFRSAYILADSLSYYPDHERFAHAFLFQKIKN